MQSVRFTIKELKRNLRFLFVVSLVTTILALILQVSLLKVEKESVQAQRDIIGNEQFVANYRNLVYNLHSERELLVDRPQLYRDYDLFDKHLELRDFNLAEPILKHLDKYENHLLHLKELNENEALFSPSHKHRKCLEVNEQLHQHMQSYRKQMSALMAQQQYIIDFVNIVIIALVMLTTFILVYAFLYARFGETK